MALDESGHHWVVGKPPRKRASEIVDAAARVFAERGYHGTSTQDIADTLGMRQASLYYYFRSKEAALELVCEHGVAGFVEAAEAISATKLPPPQKIELLIAQHLAPTETRRDYVRVFINERRYLPKAARKRIGRASRRLENIFQAVIDAGISDGSFDASVDPRLATLALLGMCNAVINWRPQETNGRTTHVADQFTALALGGLRTNRRALPGPTPPKSRPGLPRQSSKTGRKRHG